MSTPQVVPEKLAEALKEETEKYLRWVMETANAAPDGRWISGSEEQVREYHLSEQVHEARRSV